MKVQKIKFPKQSIQQISIVFQKPIQISPPSTPEEIYAIKPIYNKLTLTNNKNTNFQSNNSYSQRILQQKNNFLLPYFPKSLSPKKLNDKEISPLDLNRNTYDSIDSPISTRQPNKRATKLCTKVLQKYKNKYFI